MNLRQTLGRACAASGVAITAFTGLTEGHPVSHVMLGVVLAAWGLALSAPTRGESARRA